MSERGDIEALCEVMQKYGLTRLKVDDVELERPPFTVAVAMGAEPKKEPADEEDDPLERLKTMSPDQQDRALMLNKELP